MTIAFVTPLAGVAPDGIDAAIDALTDEQWARLEQGYIDIAQIDISKWWVPMLGLRGDIDAADLFCRLYHRMTERAAS